MVAPAVLVNGLMPRQPPVMPALGPRALGVFGARRCASMPSMLLAGDALLSGYTAALSTNPVLTQSITAAATFALSDATAQVLGHSTRPDTQRTAITALIGLLYFGPALHHYLNFVYQLFPGTGLRSVLLKTLFGQLGFGPALTCVFFAAFLIKDSGVVAGLAQLPRKIRQDLLVTWASELCFWPFVDLLCYSFVPVAWIPLGYNAANFLWTIFLSLQAARRIQS